MRTFAVMLLLVIGCQAPPQTKKATPDVKPETPATKDVVTETKQKPPVTPPQPTPIETVTKTVTPKPTIEGNPIFGLGWGMTPDQIQMLVPNMTLTEDGPVLKVYSATELPKGISGFNSYLLLFSKTYGLVKVVAIGDRFTSDSFGTSGKAAFDKITTVLAKKYTKTNGSRAIFMKLYTDADEFYQCLSHDGCGFWIDIYEAEDRAIMLRLEGAYREGYLSITVEGVPGMENTIKEKTKYDNNSAAEAL